MSSKGLATTPQYMEIVWCVGGIVIVEPVRYELTLSHFGYCAHTNMDNKEWDPLDGLGTRSTTCVPVVWIATYGYCFYCWVYLGVIIICVLGECVNDGYVYGYLLMVRGCSEKWTLSHYK